MNDQAKQEKGAGRAVSKYGQGRVYQPAGCTRWYIEYRCGGKTHREASHSTDRRVAVDLLKQRHGEVAQGRVIGPAAGRLTLADLLDMVEADYALNERKSKPPLMRLREYFGDDTKVLDITHDALVRYANHRRASVKGPDGKTRPGAGAATVRNELAVLGRGFTLAVRAGKLASRTPLPTLRVSNARSGFVEPADFAKLLPHLPRYLQPLVEVAYICGWRRSELVNLRWRNVDWAAGELRLERGTTKSGEPRAYPINAHPRLLALLREQQARVEAIQRGRGFIVPWVFCHDDGRQVAGWWQDSWGTACRKAGCPTLLFHDLRRSSVRNLVRAGISETVAMRLSGHATPSVFRRYNITSSSDLTAAVEKLAAFHANGGVPAGRVLAMPRRRRRA